MAKDMKEKVPAAAPELFSQIPAEAEDPEVTVPQEA